MKVSIIIPVYNKSKILFSCVESVLRQSFDDFEVLIIDDGSSDNSYEVMQNLAKMDNRIKIVRQENGGPGAARNKGILQSQGEYLLFIDADDTIADNMIDKIINSCDEDTDVVICGYYEYDSNNVVVKKVSEREAKIDVHSYLDIINKWKDSPLIGAPWNKLYRASVIKNNSILFPVDRTWGEDLIFNISVLEKAREISVLSDCLYKYKRAEGSLSKINHIKYGDNLECFWHLKLHAYKKIKALFINNSATKAQIISLKELELTYLYSIIHLQSLKKGFADFVNLTRLLVDECDLEAIEMDDYRRLFPKVTYLRSWLLIHCNIYIFCLFEKIFYLAVRIFRAILNMVR